MSAAAAREIGVRVAVLCLCSALSAGACGDDDGAGPGGADAPGASGDAPATVDGAPGVDTTSGGGGAGALCATSAVPPNPGSCASGLICCNTSGNSVCIYEDECGNGNMYVTCTPGGGECASVGGRVCCMVEDIMTFCTKPSSCADYDGVIVD
jgi:hypothetical protein